MFRRRFLEAKVAEKSGTGRLWCSQVKFNRVPEKVPVKVEVLVLSTEY